ncbi:chromosome partitioning protein ParA, partial [Campylobacter jejuni]|nr:chromosome partitioning protein ParA [Campylobacter jejuni]
LEIYNEVIDINPNLLALVLVNRVSPNPFLAKELENLKEYINETKKEKGLDRVIMLESVIYERQAYRKAVIEGKSMKEFCDKNDKALNDFENFYQELLKITNEKLGV